MALQPTAMAWGTSGDPFRNGRLISTGMDWEAAVAILLLQHGATRRGRIGQAMPRDSDRLAAIPSWRQQHAFATAT
jgi:hypothetical protein